jgi:hypothetical protein
MKLTRYRQAQLGYYQQAQFGYVRAETQRYQDTVQLLVAMGGGAGPKACIREGGGNLTRDDPQPRPMPTAVRRRCHGKRLG